MGTRAAALLALLFLVAGCAQTKEAEPIATATQTQAALAPAAPPPSNATEQPVAIPVAQFPHEVRLDDCLNPRMLFFLDPAVAQAALPPGYKAADATGLLRYIGFPQPPAVATGRAVAGYDFLTCSATSLGAGPQAFSEVGIFIDPPQVADPNATAVPTNLDLYLLAFHSTAPNLLDLLHAAGFSPGEAQPLAIAAQQNDLPLFQGHGSATGATPLAAAQWDGSGLGNALGVHGRYWHTSDAGTFYMDFRLEETVYAGDVRSCQHAEGSPYAVASHTTACGNEPRFAAVGTGSAIAGGLHFLPGVKPTA